MAGTFGTGMLAGLSAEELWKLLQEKSKTGESMDGMAGMMGGNVPAVTMPNQQAQGMPPWAIGKTPTPQERENYMNFMKNSPAAQELYGINPKNLNPKLSGSMTVEQAMTPDPQYRGFQESMAAGRGLGASLKEIPYSIKNTLHTAGGIAQTAAGAGIGGLTGKSAVGAGLGAAGSAIGQALIPIPGVGALVGGAAGGFLSKLFGGNDEEEEAKKKAKKKQSIEEIRGNLDRIAAMYRGR